MSTDVEPFGCRCLGYPHTCHPTPKKEDSAIVRAYRLGAHSRAQTIAAWLRTLVDWNVPLERAAEMIEAGVPWSDSELGGWDGVNPDSSAPVVEDDHEGR